MTGPELLKRKPWQDDRLRTSAASPSVEIFLILNLLFLLQRDVDRLKRAERPLVPWMRVGELESQSCVPPHLRQQTGLAMATKSRPKRQSNFGR
jgi:hypothetical protein